MQRPRAGGESRRRGATLRCTHGEQAAGARTLICIVSPRDVSTFNS
jgi:hypothetical protein